MLAETNGGNTSYYLTAGLGSTVDLRDSSGNEIESYTFDEWGNPVTAPNQCNNPLRFTGQQQDCNANRGLYYLRARFYDPALGRFLSQDPLPFLQRYGYAGDNPTTYVDPSGRCFDPASAAAVSGGTAVETGGVGPAVCGGVLLLTFACVYYNCGGAVANAASDLWGGVTDLFARKKGRNGPEKKFFDPNYSPPKPGSLWPNPASVTSRQVV